MYIHTLLVKQLHSHHNTSIQHLVIIIFHIMCHSEITYSRKYLGIAHEILIHWHSKMGKTHLLINGNPTRAGEST